MNETQLRLLEQARDLADRITATVRAAPPEDLVPLLEEMANLRLAFAEALKPPQAPPEALDGPAAP